MQEEQDSQAILDRVLLAQWPDLNLLSLKDTYNELHCFHSLVHLITHLKVGDKENDRTSEGGGKCEPPPKEINSNQSSNKEDTSHHLRAQFKAISPVETQPETLRAHTMALSRPLIQSLHILDLPREILDKIFSCLQGLGTALSIRMNISDISWLIKRKEPFRDVQSTRLVCRRFNELASPYLFPYLDVHLEMESLLRAERISKIPHLAKGVHGIRIALSYRPKEMATNLEFFKIRQEAHLDECYSTCHYMTEFCNPAELSEDGEHEEHDRTPGDPRNYYLAMRYRQIIDEAWSSYRQPEDGAEPTEENLAYQQILETGWQEFRRMHEEQLALIMDGTFVKILATSMARMPLSGNILLTDSMKYDETPHWPPDGTTTLLSNKKELASFITNPWTWSEIEEFNGPRTYEMHRFELLPTRLLSQLPIAIHKAGVTLRHMEIACFPINSDYQMLCPRETNSDDPAWDDFREACQNLRTFSIGSGVMNESCGRDRLQIQGLDEGEVNLALDEWQSKEECINRFLMAPLSSRNLERVTIRLKPLGTKDNKLDLQEYYRLGPVLSEVTWPRIQKIDISSLSLNELELERFCRGLGDTLNEADISNWQLKEGRWSAALDIVRSKLLTGCPETMPKLWLYMLESGEFGWEKVRRLSGPSVLESVHRDEPEYSTLIGLSTKYLLGVVGKNPLVGVEI